MKFGNVETNIETLEQYNELIKRIIEWYCSIKHPNYNVVKIEKKDGRKYDESYQSICKEWNNVYIRNKPLNRRKEGGEI